MLTSQNVQTSTLNLQKEILVSRAVYNVLEGPGPARLMSPYHPYGPCRGVGAVVLCTRESSNTHLGPNQGQT